MIGIGKAFVLIATFEPGVAGLLSVFDPIKETVIGAFDAQDDILQHMRGDLLIFWSQVLDLHQSALLCVVAYDQFAGQPPACLFVVVSWMSLDVHLIGVTAFGERL